MLEMLVVIYDQLSEGKWRKIELNHHQFSYMLNHCHDIRDMEQLIGTWDSRSRWEPCENPQSSELES